MSSKSKMVPITSYVFIDLETTGLPAEEHNKTKITELSMVAVTRDHILCTTPGASPRVLDKLTLCFNPRKMVSPESTRITGLDNDLLEHKTAFNTDVSNMINTFLKILPQPVCLIAHNGMGFDFPILKNHFGKLNMSLVEDVWCADCYHGFYDILEQKRKVDIENSKILTYSDILSKCIVKEGLVNVGNIATLQQNLYCDNQRSVELESSKRSAEPDDVACTVEIKIENGQEVARTNKEPDNLSKEKIAIPFTDDYSHELSAIDETDNVDWKTIKMCNETTPKQRIQQVRPATPQKAVSRVDKARRRLPYSKEKKPNELYKLPLIYERLLKRNANYAHRAESDCIYALEIAVLLGEEFVSWVDDNCCLFSDIKGMTLGTRVGF